MFRMTTPWEDALECECYSKDEYCFCEEDCGCGCTECDCADFEILNSCDCGGNCQCGGDLE